MTQRNLDLICMGRAAVDLYAEQIGAPLENGSTFAKYVGGCPANIAIGSSRLGLKTGILSRVGDEAMGRFVRNTFQQEGVDTSHLHTDKERLTALVLLGINPPDDFPLIFYRENCADMAIAEQDFSEQTTFENAHALLITGTHCSKKNIFEVTKKAAQQAKKANAKLILDIDYRPVLWGAAGHGQGEERYVAHSIVSKRLSHLLGYCDLIVGTEEEILVAANKDNLTEALAFLNNNSQATIVQKRGEKGCVAYYKGERITGDPFPVKVLNVLGAGDAFMSGFLRGYLKGLPLQQCCNLANANGALVVSRHGCAPAMPYWDELQFFIENPQNMPQTEQLHCSMQKPTFSENRFLLAFDHRSYFEGFPPKKIQDFKLLIYEAFKKAKTRLPETYMGLIVDDQYGGQVLKKGARDNCYTVRCIEEPNQLPLKFLKNKEAAAILRTWPKSQVVKVLCQVTSERGTQQLQIVKLKQLYDATTNTGHQLLIELIGTEGPWNVINECYQAGIYPTWWKLPPIADNNMWNEIGKLIENHDPTCQGILILGDNRPFEDLSKRFEKVNGQTEKIKGFAVGRTLWGAAAEGWFHEKISDQEVIDEVSHNFISLISAWSPKPRKESYDNHTGSKNRDPHSHHGASPYFVPDSTKSGAV